MTAKTLYIYLMVAGTLGLNAYGQNRPYAGELKKVAEMVMSLRDMSYQYQLTAEYPNGQKDKLSGFTYFGNDDKLMYNSNDAFTMIYTKKWFFKADHREKTVVVVNLEKHLTKDYKEHIEREIFGGGTLSFYFDSVLLKHASVKKLRKVEDTVNMELSFPPESPVKSIYLSYDEKDKTLIAYRLYAFQPWNTNEFGKGKGTSQTIACRDFKKGTRNDEYRADRFFTVKKNNVVLKKYTTYKLNTKL